jgi:hypothetical protein
MFSPATAAAQLMHAPRVLKVQVIAPPTLNLLNDNRLNEAFVARVRETFNRCGFPVPIEATRPVEDASKIPHLLTIKVAAWKMDHSGNFDCTFTANLKAPQRSLDLGVFSNTTIHWRGGIAADGISTPVVEANNEAFEQLCAEVSGYFGLPSLITELSA